MPADPLDVPLPGAGEPRGPGPDADDANDTGPGSHPVGRVLALPRRRLDLHRRFAVMGIVNRTRDSFYDAGETFDLESAVARVRAHVDAGADIVDLGGVSAGPGEPVGRDEEIGRIVPLVRAARAEGIDALLSVDTFEAAVADAALTAGADIVNDVTGGHDPDVLRVVAAHGAGYVAVHGGGPPRTPPFRPAYRPDVVAAVVEHLRALTERALRLGLAPDRILVDPGHDMHKTTAHSLELCRRVPELLALGFPVLVALSNKDFVGETLDAGLSGRVDGSLAAAVFTALRGAHVVRVHEVARTVAVLRMTESLLGWRRPAVAVRGLG